MSPHPLALLDRALRLILRPRDRDTISGDLLEIYADQKLPELGPFRANLWYASQFFSILPHRILSLAGGNFMKTLSIAASLFVVLAGSWLACMELILRHPGFIPRTGGDLIIVVYAALCFIYLRSQPIALRLTLTLAALCILVFGVFALVTVLHSSHFEGYLLVFSLGLIVQGALMLFDTLQRPRLRPA